VVQRYVLDQIADPRLRVYVVWEALFDSDDEAAARAATPLMPDPRAVQFWSAGRSLGEAFRGVLGLREPVAWDVFLIFPVGAVWHDPAPQPQLFMHQLDSLPAERRMNGTRLGQEVAAALGQRSSPP
jgi:hypothetical protein